jgi:chromosome segregation ATPase
VLKPESGGRGSDLQADEVLTKGHSWTRDLPVVLRRALERARPNQHPSGGPDREREAQLQAALDRERTARAEIEQQLAHARAAFETAEERSRTAVAAATEQLARQQAHHEREMARTAATREMIDEQLRDAAVRVAQSRQDQSAAEASVQRLSRREAELSSLIADATTSRLALERRLADAETAREAASARATHERRAAEGQFAERRRGLEAQIAEEIEKRKGIEQTLARAQSEREAAEQRHASAIADLKARAGELEESLQLARQYLQSSAANVEQLAKREAQLTAKLSDAVKHHTDLEHRLAAADAAHQDATARATRDRTAAAQRAADREAELDARIQQERATCAGLKQALADAEATLQNAQQQYEAALTAAAEERTKLEAHRAAIAERLADAEAALERERQRCESAGADVARLQKREAELTSQLAEVVAVRHKLGDELAAAAAAVANLEQAVADADAARHEAQQRHEAALTGAAQDRAERQTAFDRELTRTEAARQDLAQRLIAAEADLQQQRNEHRLAAAEIERLTRCEAELTSHVADLEADRNRLGRQLTDAATALESAAEREKRLKQQIVDRDAELREAQRRHEDGLTAAARARQESQAQFDHKLAEMVAARDSVAERLLETDRALEEERRGHQSAMADVARLTQRETDLSSRLSEVEAVRDRFGSELSDALGELENAARREKALDDRIRHEQATRAALEEALATAEAAITQGRHEHDAATADIERLTRIEIELRAQLAAVQAGRDGVDLQLAEAVNAIAAADERSARERAAAAARQADLESRLAAAIGSREAVERTLAQARSAAHEAEQSLTEQINALRARALEQALEFETQLADQRWEHDAQIHLLGEEHRDTCERFEQARTSADADIAKLTAECQEVERTLAAARNDFQASLERLSREHSAALAARDHEIGKLQGEIASVKQTLQAVELRRDALQREADRIPQLVRQLDDSRAESERLFGQAHVAMFRCSRDGTLIQANRAWSALVRRSTEELKDASTAAAVFESPNDLTWLIERCLNTRTKESTETTVRREDGARLFVRLSACASAVDVIEIVAEDMTRPRILQDRLAQAGRLEAVGRLASEVALSCGKLLAEIRQNAERWLLDAGSIESRRHGEVLLEELTRAAGYLQQLVVFGDKQTRAPALVDLHTVVRDLVPVLKHVAGDNVDVRLPEPASSLTVDVESERVERLLVNLAAYGRERMPFGGRLTIEVGTSIVDRQFAARYPNVRPGPHALITVTEARRAARADGLLQFRGGPPLKSHETSARKPEVDLGTLQGLVGECGGHLWMKVQPLGDIVAKIRLPLRTSYGQTQARTAARRGPARAIARWFQH